MDNPSSSERPDHDQPKKKMTIVEKEEVPAALEVWDEEPPEDLDELDKYIDRFEKWSAIFDKDPRDSEKHMERFNKCMEKFMKDTKWINVLTSGTEVEVGKISSVGFTKREYNACGSYLTKFSFEYENPRKYSEVIAYIKQVRQTKGYGVTVCCSQLVLDYYTQIFAPMMNTWRKDPKLRDFIGKEMVEALLDSMFDELQQRYVSLGVTNVVMCILPRLYFVSVSVEEATPTLEKEEEEEEEAKVVEAMVFFQSEMDWKLEEWKLKKGPQVVYYSKSAELLN